MPNDWVWMIRNIMTHARLPSCGGIVDKLMSRVVRWLNAVTKHATFLGRREGENLTLVSIVIKHSLLLRLSWQVSARKLKPHPPRPRSLHERLLEDIKAERKLRPVSPDMIRRSRLGETLTQTWQCLYPSIPSVHENSCATLSLGRTFTNYQAKPLCSEEIPLLFLIWLSVSANLLHGFSLWTEPLTTT